MKWLEDNPVGVVLSALCGALLLVLLLLTVVSSLPLSPAVVMSEAGENDPGLDLPKLAEKQPIDTYSVITRRPLFAENRQPGADADGANGDALLADEPVDAPEVELSGVVLTPTLRMVTLKRKDNEQSLVAFEGKPIEADFGSWQVSTIHARAATLTSGAGEELQLEMQVHDEAIAAPAVPKKAKAEEETAADGETTQEQGDAEPLSRAEEIRQRIAERREELRREAEQQGQGEEQPDPETYQNAIQSMIGSKRRGTSDNENEQ